MSIYGYTPLLVYSAAVAFVFGACMGSFLNCAAWRIVNGESFLRGHSHCTSCGHELGFKDLIPLVSWLSTKGKCRYCGEKVSARYPLTELAFAIITVVCLLKFDLTILCLRNFIFLAVLFLLTLTDIEDMTIPDGCHIVAILAWIAAEPFLYTGTADVLKHVLAGLVFGGGLLSVSLILDRIMGRDTLGGGDIKLIAIIGLYLGFTGTLFTLMLSCIGGLLFNVIANRRASGGEEGDEEEDAKAFPFGPWIALAAAVMLLFGEPLINWYQNLIM